MLGIVVDRLIDVHRNHIGNCWYIANIIGKIQFLLTQNSLDMELEWESSRQKRNVPNLETCPHNFLDGLLWHNTMIPIPKTNIFPVNQVRYPKILLKVWWFLVSLCPCMSLLSNKSGACHKKCDIWPSKNSSCQRRMSLLVGKPKKYEQEILEENLSIMASLNAWRIRRFIHNCSVSQKVYMIYSRGPGISKAPVLRSHNS